MGPTFTSITLLPVIRQMDDTSDWAPHLVIRIRTCRYTGSCFMIIILTTGSQTLSLFLSLSWFFLIDRNRLSLSLSLVMLFSLIWPDCFFFSYQNSCQVSTPLDFSNHEKVVSLSMSTWSTLPSPSHPCRKCVGYRILGTETENVYVMPLAVWGPLFPVRFEFWERF